MNREDFVTYEQAVILKELGFDWYNQYTQMYYATQNYCEGNNPYSFDTICTGDLISSPKMKEDENGGWIEDEDYCVLAPTLSQAQKWLREVKKSDILIDKENNFYIGVFWNPFMETYQSIEKFSISRSDNFASENGMYDFDTYEECLSKGITQLLNLLTYKTEKK